jgi:hypothetical protein
MPPYPASYCCCGSSDTFTGILMGVTCPNFINNGLADVSRESLEGTVTIKRQGEAQNAHQPRSFCSMFRDKEIKVFSCPLYEGI